LKTKEGEKEGKKIVDDKEYLSRVLFKMADIPIKTRKLRMMDLCGQRL
jgi:hypothetical protein